jgi:hypothetical protein
MIAIANEAVTRMTCTNKCFLMFKNIGFVFICCLLIGCSKRESTMSAISVDLSSKVDVGDFFEDYHSVTLATGDEYLIREIDKILIKSDTIYILDKRNFTITVFDINGNYLNHLRRQGNGPGDYLDIADFMLVDSTIMILSRVMKKILVYSKNLNYTDSYSLDDFYDYC